MRRRAGLTGLVLLGLLAYAGFLVLTVPLPVAWPWIGPRVPVRLYQPTGTLWSGAAASVIQGPRRLDAVHWTVHPARLLTLGLAAEVSGQLPDGRLQGDFVLRPGGTLHLRHARADMEVDTLLTWAGRGGLEAFAAGHFEALLNELELKRGRPVSADGVLNWNGAAIGEGGDIPLGNLALRLQPGNDAGIRGKLVADGGVLALDGDVTVAPDGRFTVQASIGPRDPGDPRARRLTNMLGLANPEGTTRVTITGNLGGGGIRVRQKAG